MRNEAPTAQIYLSSTQSPTDLFHSSLDCCINFFKPEPSHSATETQQKMPHLCKYMLRTAHVAPPRRWIVLLINLRHGIIIRPRIINECMPYCANIYFLTAHGNYHWWTGLSTKSRSTLNNDKKYWLVSRIYKAHQTISPADRIDN